METTTKFLAWHSDPALKAEVMERLRKHREADAFVQGVYQVIDPEKALGYRGCAIGCTLPPQPQPQRGSECGCGCEAIPEGGWHGAVERLYGIDYWAGSMIDSVFESLAPEDCAAFAVDVVEAIPVGADLSVIDTWAFTSIAEGWGREDSYAVAAEFIERLRNAPVPTPA